MCLILLAYRGRDDYPLVIAANRDEYYERPAQPAAFWTSSPDLLAGRDLRAGGTWLGITRSGRFAAITNYRSSPRLPSPDRSRGKLTLDFLQGTLRPLRYAEQVMAQAEAFNGFNLLVGQLTGDAPQLIYCNNVNGSVQELEPGLYGLSNHLLDTGWPKVERGKQRLRTLLENDQTESLRPEALLTLLADATRAPDTALPNTGIGLATERLLAPIFIQTESYGTCCSTAIIVNRHHQVTFQERSFYSNRHSPSAVSNDEVFCFPLHRD